MAGTLTALFVPETLHYTDFLLEVYNLDPWNDCLIFLYNIYGGNLCFVQVSSVHRKQAFNKCNELCCLKAVFLPLRVVFMITSSVNKWLCRPFLYY